MDVEDFLAQTRKTDNPLSLTIKGVGKFRSKRDCSKLIPWFRYLAGALPEEDSIQLLQASLRMQDLRLADAVAKRFDLSLKSSQGLRDVLPLLKGTENPVFLKTIIRQNLIDQTIESEFGKVDGLLAFSSASTGNIFTKLFVGEISWKKSFVYQVGACSHFENRGWQKFNPFRFKAEEEVEKVFLRGMENWGPFFLRRAEDGESILRKERKIFNDLASSKDVILFRQDLLSSGNLNMIARCWLPGDECFVLGSKKKTENITKLASSNHQVMKELVEELLFDDQDVLTPGFARTFWQENKYSGWVSQVGDLFENGLLTPHQAVALLQDLILEDSLDLDSYRFLEDGCMDNQIKQIEKLWEGLRSSKDCPVFHLSSGAPIIEFFSRSASKERPYIKEVRDRIVELTVDVEKHQLIKVAQNVEDSHHQQKRKPLKI